MNALLLGGSEWQMPMLHYLQKKKVRVTVVNPDRTEVAILADSFIRADVRDIPRIVDEIGGQYYHPMIVTSDQSDVAVMPVAVLSAALGVDHNDVGSTLLFTDKMAMFDHASQNAVICPFTKEIDDEQDLHNWDLPVVIKPPDVNASRGFCKIDRICDAKVAINAAKSISFTNRAIVQKYIKGNMLILDGICSGGRHKTLAHASQSRFRDGVSSSVTYPSHFKEDVLVKAIEMNDRFVNTSGLEFGLTHAEYIVDDQGHAWLIDMAARGGGFGIGSHIVPWVSGINTYDILFDSMLGKIVQVSALHPLTRAAKLKFFEFPSGRVAAIEGVGAARKLDGVAECRININLGQVIRPAYDGKSRHGYALMLANTNGEIMSIEDELDKTIKVAVAGEFDSAL